jgi:hypothetical protein
MEQKREGRQWHQQSRQQNSVTNWPCCSLRACKGIALQQRIHQITSQNVSNETGKHWIRHLTANEPGAFLAAVHPHPLYSANPSSATILKTPRPLNASGFVCRLIFSTSSGRSTISPIPIKLMQVSNGNVQNATDHPYLPAVA